MNHTTTMPSDGIQHINRISGPWAGKASPGMTGQCIRAFLNHGREFQLPSYQDHPGLPAPENGYQTENKKKVDVLVGICSSLAHPDRREAVRDTWLTKPVPGVECLFFLGNRTPLDKEPDVVTLNAGDGYYDLPAKVVAFFRHALDHYDFQWIFKCDDDTFVDLARLVSLTTEEADIIGNTMLDDRGSPSGGAGYFLSRGIVEKIVRDNSIPASGYEDVLIGEKAMALGARKLSTDRLCHHSRSYPTGNNALVTSHWCRPEVMRAIHTIRYAAPDLTFPAVHEHWHDDILFFGNGVFARKSTCCNGQWNMTDKGELLLTWFDCLHDVLAPQGLKYTAGGFTVHCPGEDELNHLIKLNKQREQSRQQ